jgi:hypothetical protein
MAQMTDSDLKVMALKERLPPWTRDLLAVLTEREHAAFVLREPGMTLAEVAEQLDVSVERAGDLARTAARKMIEAARRRGGEAASRTQWQSRPGICTAARWRRTAQHGAGESTNMASWVTGPPLIRARLTACFCCCFHLFTIYLGRYFPIRTKYLATHVS